MQRITYIILLTLCVPLRLALGQTLSLSGRVHAQDVLGEALPYVSVGILHTPKGTITDETGHFILQANRQDTVVFSSVGYEPMQLPAAAVGSVVCLRERSTILPAVRVTAQQKSKTKETGNCHARTLVGLGGANQYAMLLHPSPTQGVLKELVFTLQPATRLKGRRKTALRVRVYTNAEGRPGADLLPQTIMASVAQSAKQLRIDVSRFAIPVPPEGVFIGIDFLGFYNEQGSFLPFSRVDRPQHLRIPFSAGNDHPTFSRFFGTDWQPTRHQNSNSTAAHISAKFGASLFY